MNQDTLMLPAFVTGNTAPAGPPATVAKPLDKPDKLPSSERNMLIFVALLLAIGTAAIVMMAMLG